MQITVTGQNIEVTEALKQHAEKAFSKLAKHNSSVEQVHAVLQMNNQEPKVEATLHIPGHTLHGSAQHKDMYQAIDDAAHKLDRQVIKYKEKNQNHHHQKPQFDVTE